jgi:disulfide bond formation protein DsbB
MLDRQTGPMQTLIAAGVAAGMALTVLTALGFQHLGGFIPCKLCLEQRVPYYVGIPIMVAAAISGLMRAPAPLTRGLLLAGGAVMLWSLWLGAFHSGVEWSWWQGPADCGVVAAPQIETGRGVLDAIDTVVPPSCDEAAGRFLGLSFAGWNVVASLILAAASLRGALGSAR